MNFLLVIANSCTRLSRLVEQSLSIHLKDKAMKVQINSGILFLGKDMADSAGLRQWPAK